MRNYYDMLSLPRTAPADEIKKAFRREIARYHPDKVQHLGAEFQEMAAGIAADLTEAYRILMDPALRAKYDEQLAAPGAAPPMASPPRPPEPPPPPSPSNTAPGPSEQSGARAAERASAGIDFVRRAALSKIREAIDEAAGNAMPLTANGFDVGVVIKPKKGLFKKAEDSTCLLVKFVPSVDPDAVARFWPAAAKVRAPETAGCVLMLVGAGLAPARDLSGAISELRRKSRSVGPVLVPVDVRDWDALFPPDTPTVVRNILQRLKDDKR